MHDIDRSFFETGLGETGGVFESETEFGEFGEMTGETYEAATPALQEAHEVALTSELLEVTNEAELDRFLGSLLSTAATAAGNLARSDTGRALGGILKDAAGKALPVVGRAIGRRISPTGGGVWGERLASAAGKLFGLELEGLSQEDREFEVARAFVRFAHDAASRAAVSPPGPPVAVATQAAVSAARRHAPGLLPALASGREPASSERLRRRSGRWVRRGNSIVLLDV